MKTELRKEITHLLELDQEELGYLLFMLDEWVALSNKLPLPDSDQQEIYFRLLNAYKAGQAPSMDVPFKELNL